MNADKRGFKHHNLTNRVIGVFYEVYNDLGQGFLESVYQEAMAVASPEGFGWSGEHGSVSSFVARWGGSFAPKPQSKRMAFANERKARPHVNADEGRCQELNFNRDLGGQTRRGLPCLCS